MTRSAVRAMVTSWTLVRVLAIAGPALAFVAIAMLVMSDGHPGWAELSFDVQLTGGLFLVLAALLALRLRAGEWRDRPDKARKLKIGKVFALVLVAMTFTILGLRLFA